MMNRQNNNNNNNILIPSENILKYYHRYFSYVSSEFIGWSTE